MKINENNSSYQINSNKTKVIEKTPQEIIDEYKQNCIVYDYKTIFRNSEEYNNKFAKFTGKVIQVQDGYSNSYILRVNVTKDQYGFYDDTIYVSYYPMEGATRILEDDIVTIYGNLSGLKTYKTIFNAEVTLPYIISKYIEVKE